MFSLGVHSGIFLNIPGHWSGGSILVHQGEFSCVLASILQRNRFNRMCIHSHTHTHTYIYTHTEIHMYTYICCRLITQCCPALFDPMDCSLSGSSVHGISQTRILKWVTISYSRRSSRFRDQTHHISCIGRLILYH